MAPRKTRDQLESSAEVRNLTALVASAWAPSTSQKELFEAAERYFRNYESTAIVGHRRSRARFVMETAIEVRLAFHLARCLAETPWSSVTPQNLAGEDRDSGLTKLEVVMMIITMMTDVAMSTVSELPDTQSVLEQFTEGGICWALPAAAEVIPPLLEQLSGDGLIAAQDFVLDMINASVSPFRLAGRLQRNNQGVTTPFAKNATPFWEEVRQHSTLQRLAQLTAICRGNSLNRWKGAKEMGMVMHSLIQSHPWAGVEGGKSCNAALDFHGAAARDPALQSFVSETPALLCSDVMAGRCTPQEAAVRQEHFAIKIYSFWIHVTRLRGDWAPTTIRALFSIQGLMSCLAPFVYGAPGASLSLTTDTYYALMVSNMLRGDAPSQPANPNHPSVDEVNRAVTEHLVQGMVRQAAALLQLRRLPAVTRLAAAQKAATAGFLQGSPEHVMTVDRPGETVQQSVDDKLEQLVQAVHTLTLMCSIRTIKRWPSMVEPRDLVMTLEAVMRTLVPLPDRTREYQFTFTETLHMMVGALEGEMRVRAVPWPADRALSFAVSMCKAMPAGSNPEYLMLNLNLMAEYLPVTTLQAVTLEMLPFLMRAVGACGSQEIAGAQSSLTDLGKLLHEKGCATEVGACAVESAACQHMASAEVVGGQAADPCALDVEALRMQHPVLGCFNPRCTSLSGVSEDLMKTQRCRACRRAAYCSAACQIAHWPAHKASCAVRSEFLATKAASAAGVAPGATMDTNNEVE